MTNRGETNMKKSLVPAKPIDLPKELEKFFGDPPLIGSEKLEEYKAFFSVIATAAKPADDIVWILVRELVDTWWELRRERLIKLETIRLKQQEYVAETQTPTRADYERDKMLARQMALDEDDEPSAFRLKEFQPKEKKQEAPITVLTKAYLHGGGDIDFVDKRISALEYRRSGILREVDRRNQIVARSTDKACSDFVDAEFTEPRE